MLSRELAIYSVLSELSCGHDLDQKLDRLLDELSARQIVFVPHSLDFFLYLSNSFDLWYETPMTYCIFSASCISLEQRIISWHIPSSL